MPEHKIYSQNDPIINRQMNSEVSARIMMSHYTPAQGLIVIRENLELKLIPLEPKAIEPDEAVSYAKSFMIYASAVEDMVKLAETNSNNLSSFTSIVSDDNTPQIWLPVSCNKEELVAIGFAFGEEDGQGWVQAIWPKGWSIKVQSRSNSIIYDEDNNPRISLMFTPDNQCVVSVIYV